MSKYKELKDYFLYKDGKLFWNKSDLRRVKKGQEASIKRPDGYLRVGFKGELLYVHRVVFYLHHGRWPKDGFEIDHINRDRSDNRIENLREVTRQQNAANRDLPSGRNFKDKGIYWVEDRQKYRVRLKLNGIFKHFGYFKELKDAEKARNEAVIYIEEKIKCHYYQ